jgi:hypothetical protein
MRTINQLFFKIGQSTNGLGQMPPRERKKEKSRVFSKNRVKKPSEFRVYRPSLELA